MSGTITTNLYWSWVTNDSTRIVIAASDVGLRFVGSMQSSVGELEDWANRYDQTSELIEDPDKCQPYVQQLAEYLRAERTEFTIPIDVRGTAFQLQVWEALQSIPYGQTRSYTDIANHIGRPSSVRAVGAAIGANPLMITIPCHRVIAKNGSLTGYRGGLNMKAYLLQLEGSYQP